MKISKDYYRGCLLGGVVGDAEGYGVYEGEKKLISDNSQLTFFTVDGLIWADHKANKRGVYAYIPCLFYSYQKWLYTQTGSFADKNYDFLFPSEILECEELFARRGVGNTSLESLAGSINGKYGTIKNRINNSKSCGAVMRAAPIGMYFCKDSKEAYNMGCQGGAITHGNPKGFLPAGFLAYIISDILKGEDIESSAMGALAELKKDDEKGEIYAILKKAILLAKSDTDCQTAMEQLGTGWIGSEAMALALYCSLKFENDFEMAINVASHYSGNKDTISSICGNLLGAHLGSLEIPYKWVHETELTYFAVTGADKLLNTVK
ncbi:ADP-ribosylglycohydrolase family protein [Anaerovorax odorimutans]|uniref:ADP-ribosylglycohydrolase family protein n=1 Tax=Anaerovorax odorimutans TaxID=109327 RepID=UPI0004113714|nr:ADP-ribosylglycohydrolase family protein [Anaerovorax odorimutans]